MHGNGQIYVVMNENGFVFVGLAKKKKILKMAKDSLNCKWF